RPRRRRRAAARGGSARLAAACTTPVAAGLRETVATRWGREDSNLRRLSRRVYSPFPLATRAHPRVGHCSQPSPPSTITVVARYDVIVVGAGPAGSTTAYRLARAGARVLLLDKARFPRDKPCGGGLTIRAVKELPVDPEPVVEHVVHRFEFRFRYDGRFVRGSGPPLILMTQRRRLDHFLAEQAAGAGTVFRDGVKVSAVEADDRGARVVVDGSPVIAEVVIGADGAN